MTSDISWISKLIEHSTSNGTLSNRLLSPIAETSTEIHSLSLPINQTCSNISPKSSNIVLINANPTLEELHRILLQNFHQCTTNFHQIQTYLNNLEQHFQSLSSIIKSLLHDTNLIDIIELIETRLVQMRAKGNQINYLLNHSSIQTMIQQITPYLLQSKILIDDEEFLTSLQLSLNQKTILIDHLKNEYRYRKYQMKTYSSQIQAQYDLLRNLRQQIDQIRSQHEQFIEQVNHISIYNEHHRQCLELMNLTNEFKQLQNENQLLTLQAKENRQKLSLLMQFNHQHGRRKSD